MSISDDANQNNTINYRSDGRTDHWDSSLSQTIYGNHDMPLDTLAITVTGGSDPKTDFLPPKLNSFSFSASESLNKFTASEGEKFHVYYDAQDEIGVGSARIVFRNDTGLEIYGYDYDDDGIITVKAGHPWSQSTVYPNGLYSFYRFEISDNQNNSNSGTLTENGVFNFYDQEFSEQVYQIFDPAFDGFNLTLTGGSEEQTDFTPPTLLSLELLDNDVSKGEKIKIKYNASDEETGFNSVQIYFRNSDGQQIYGYDNDNDGIITLNISDNQNSGEYLFDYLTLTDNAFQQNQVTYRSNGQLEYYDKINKETVTEKYSVDLDIGQANLDPVTLSVTVIQDTDGNNKFAIDGNLLETIEFTPGRTYIFDQSDTSNADHPLVLSTTNDGSHSGGVAYETGLTIVGTPGEAGALSTFVTTSDTPDLYIYCSAHSGMGTAVVPVLIPLKDVSINVVENVNDPAKDADATPPVLTAITLDQTTAEAGKVLKINYSASDDVSDLREVVAYFRNDNGQTLSLRDNDNDGILSANISSTQQDGSYKLDYVRIYDDATNSNSITYYPDGKTAFYSKEYETTLNSRHDLNLSEISFNVTGGRAEKTDFTPPILTSVSFEDTDFVAGEKAKVQFQASDADTGIRELNFYFRHKENNNQISFSDNENDGTAVRNLSTNIVNGIYNLDYVRIYDNAGNSVRYYDDGTFKFYDETISTEVQGRHEIDLASLSFSVSGGMEIQTDYSPPELISYAIETLEIPAGDRVLINYSALDAENNISSVRFNFRNEDGSQSFSIYDNYGDGVASYRLSTNQKEGLYTLNSITLNDTALNQNSITLNSNGTTNYYDSSTHQTVYGEHEFNFANFSFNVTESISSPNPQTDYTPPVLEDLLLVSQADVIEIVQPDPDTGNETDEITAPDPIYATNADIIAKAGEKLQFYYDASDLGSEVRSVSMYFRNEFGQSIYGSDERDGVVTLNIGSNLYSSDFVLDYIQLYDDNDRSNHVTYNSNGTYREQTWNLEKNSWDYFTSTYDLPLKDLKITVTDGKPPQDDFIAPELVSVSFSKTEEVTQTTQAAGEKLQFYYDASDLGSSKIRVDVFQK